MTISGPEDAQGFRPLANNTPAIIDYINPGAQQGSALHRYFHESVSQFRYTLLVYQEPVNFSKSNVPVPSSRRNFNTSKFESSQGFGTPIGGNMFFVGDPFSGPSVMPGSGPSPATTSVMPSASAISSAAKAGYAVWNLRFCIAIAIVVFYVGLYPPLEFPN